MSAGWVAAARCAGVSLDRMVPATNGLSQPLLDELRVTAETFCAGCPVQDVCRRVGDDGREQGLWGGVYRVDAGRGYTREVLLPGIELGPLPAQRPPTVARRQKPGPRSTPSRRCSSGSSADRYAAVEQLIEQGVSSAEQTGIPERTVNAAARRHVRAAS